MKLLNSIFLIVLILFTGQAMALTMQLPPSPNGHTEVFYRFQKPVFADDPEHSFLTGVHDIGVFIRLGKGALVFDLPFSIADFENNEYSHDTLSFGNMYVGFATSNPGRNPNIRVGLNLPTAEKSGLINTITALFTDPLNVQKFAQDRLTFQLGVILDTSQPNGFFTHVDFGPEIFIPTGDSNGDVEVGARYGVDLGVRQSSLEFKMEFAGFWMISEEDSFFESTLHTLSFGAEYQGRLLSPGVYLTKPLDEDLDLVDWMIGFQIRVTPGS